MTRLIALSAASTIALFAICADVLAVPFRGSVHWSVLLCKYTDSGVPPQSADFYRDMFLRLGSGGLADYWQSISMGSINFAGSVVKGWYTVPMTVAQAKAKSGGPNPHRKELVEDCIAAARKAATEAHQVPLGGRVVAITFPEVDMFGETGRVLLSHTVELGAMAHEVGHGLGLKHSYSDDPNYRNAVWSAPGEYDDEWDVMSWAHVFKVRTDRFGRSAPGLNAYYRDYMGWLPRSRMVTFGADGVISGSVTLAALGQSDVMGPYLVRVPFDLSDRFHYYTIEYRRRNAWDAGIPSDLVLLHEIVRHSDGRYYATLLRERSGRRSPLKELHANGVTISVVSLDGNYATVKIDSGFAKREPQNPARSVSGPNTCKAGYVWREADESDWVCVSMATRTQVQKDNARATRGPCEAGLVSREAFPGDRVCVTAAVRAQTIKDNMNASNRVIMR
jgi:hypothetical protein